MIPLLEATKDPRLPAGMRSESTLRRMATGGHPAFSKPRGRWFVDVDSLLNSFRVTNAAIQKLLPKSRK